MSVFEQANIDHAPFSWLSTGQVCQQFSAQFMCVQDQRK